MEIETHAELSSVSEGYWPQIRIGDAVLWEGTTVVPFEHGDYDNTQEAKAKAIAENHLITRLKSLFEETT